MNQRKRQRLNKAGWRVGSPKELLGLTDQEGALIELKLDLAAAIVAERSKRGMTQRQLAHMLGSSQSRIAKMEAADASVSVDLMVRGLFTLGLGTQDVAKQLMHPRKAA